MMADATPKIYTIEEVRERIKLAVEKAGNQKAFAGEVCVSPPMVSMTLTGSKRPSNRILKAIGMRKVIYYEDLDFPTNKG